MTADDTTPIWERPLLTPSHREQVSGHRGAVVWFTGLSGSGKTTVARALDQIMHAERKHSFLMDGDVLREGITSDLGFSPEDREENLRRFTEVARLFANAGMLTLVSAISPYEEIRENAKQRIGPDRFILVHVATPLEVCEARDVKGLYAKARAGEIKQFTGLDAPYEEPKNPDLKLVPEDGDPEVMAKTVWKLLEERGFLGGQ